MSAHQHINHSQTIKLITVEIIVYIIHSSFKQQWKIELAHWSESVKLHLFFSHQKLTICLHMIHLIQAEELVKLIN